MARKRSLEKSKKEKDTKGAAGMGKEKTCEEDEKKPEAESKSIQKKRSLKHGKTEKWESSDSEEDYAKRRKVDVHNEDLSSSEVEIYATQSSFEGVSVRETYTCKRGAEQKSLQEIKLLLDTEEVCKLSMCELRSYYLYPAFKEALTRLLTKIEEVVADENNKIKMIMVHGVPNIGKSTLAQCLAYYLSLYAGTNETVHLMRLSHSAKSDSYSLADYIRRTSIHKYFIVDQVNTHALDLSHILGGLQSKFLFNRNAVPLIMFTSGHYAPGKSWLAGQRSGWLCYKVIQMQINTALIEELKEQLDVPNDVSISNEDLLEVTTIYKRMDSCLVYLRDTDPAATKNSLRSNIYPSAELEYMGRECITHLIWVAWHELLSLGLPSRTEFTDDLCTMRPHLVEYLGYLISRIKDPSDKGINALLNQMDIRGGSLFERNNYCEFDPNSYCYIFLNKNPLYDVLKHTLDLHNALSAAERLQVIVKSINLLRSEGSHLNYVSGGLLECLIIFNCKAEQERRGFEIGMVGYGSTIDFVKVDYFVSASTVDELCNLPLHTKACDEDLARLFVVLNVPGKRAFKGYDFAFVEVNHSGGKICVQQMQLFQVTVNPDGKSIEQKINMADVFIDIRDKLKKLELIKSSEPERVIRPFFVGMQPNDERGIIELPGKGTPIPCKVLVCPQELLGK